MAIYRLAQHTPELGEGAWVAESATVLGRVVLGPAASVWYGAVLRGDNDLITLGARTNIQDGSVLHTDLGKPLTLGADVTIGHQVMLHGCTVGDGALVGIQAIVLNGARIGRHCLVGAGALVTEGKEFPDGVLILGRPAKVVRALTAHEIAELQSAAGHYVTQSQRHRDQLVRLDPPASGRLPTSDARGRP
jgi:carbonic anhydrase/acetyltransferase-like protein (isoleucine patch superfamily)